MAITAEVDMARGRPSTMVAAGIEMADGKLEMAAVMVVAITEGVGWEGDLVAVERQAVDLLAVSRERLLEVAWRLGVLAQQEVGLPPVLRREARLLRRLGRRLDKRLQRTMHPQWLPPVTRAHHRDRPRLLLEAARFKRSQERRRLARRRRHPSARAGDPLTEFA